MAAKYSPPNAIKGAVSCMDFSTQDTAPYFLSKEYFCSENEFYRSDENCFNFDNPSVYLSFFAVGIASKFAISVFSDTKICVRSFSRLLSYF